MNISNINVGIEHGNEKYRKEYLKRAMELANILMIEDSKIIEDKNELLFYDLTLIIGKDYITLPSYREAVLFQPPF